MALEERDVLFEELKIVAGGEEYVGGVKSVEIAFTLV